MATQWRSIVMTALAFLFALPHCAQAEFVPVAGFDRQLFPSYLIATANMKPDGTEPDPHRLGDASGILGVDLVAPTAGATVKVTVECREFLDTSIYSGTLAEEGVSYRITPKIKYHYDRLARHEQAAPINVTYRVQFGAGVEEEQTVTCTLRSINDCPHAFKDGDNAIDFSLAFAAYVNEQHPYVDKLLREALDREVVELFRGYQARDPQDVIKQAYAVWDVLVARDVKYSSITTTAVASESVICQHVRLLEDSINNSQANCVDGSVLWVSMMRKIGIDGFLVITPDHCYAGFYLAPGQQAPLAIETTLLGTELSEDEVAVEEIFDTAIPEDDRYDYSFYSFVAALEHGTGAYTASTAEEPAADAVPVKIVDIAEMRKLGVLPIAFQHTQDFVGYDFRLGADDDESEEMSDEADDESAPDAYAAADTTGEEGEPSGEDAPDAAADATEEWDEDAPFRDGAYSVFGG